MSIARLIDEIVAEHNAEFIDTEYLKEKEEELINYIIDQVKERLKIDLISLDDYLAGKPTGELIDK